MITLKSIEDRYHANQKKMALKYFELTKKLDVTCAALRIIAEQTDDHSEAVEIAEGALAKINNTRG